MQAHSFDYVQTPKVPCRLKVLPHDPLNPNNYGLMSGKMFLRSSQCFPSDRPKTTQPTLPPDLTLAPLPTLSS